MVAIVNWTKCFKETKQHRNVSMTNTDIGWHLKNKNNKKATSHSVSIVILSGNCSNRCEYNESWTSPNENVPFAKEMFKST